MEQSFITQLWGGIQLILNQVNWMFVPIFIVLTWLFNEGTESPVSFKWLNWLQKIPRAWRTFISGIILACLFAWFYGLTKKSDIAGLLYAILIGMIAWKLGIETVFEWIKSHIWRVDLSKPNPIIPKDASTGK